METFTTGQPWFDELIPRGIRVPSSTIISGGGGTGKPLVGAMLLTAWLQKGGSIIHFLINSDREYAEKILSLYHLNPSQFARQIYFIHFDPEISTIQEVSENEVRANILLPDHWEESLSLARGHLPDSDLPPYIFGAALNLLFFSRTYGNDIAQRVLNLMKQGEHCLFTLSNNVFQDKARMLEDMADNLMFTRTEKPMRLFLKITRMKDVPFKTEEVEVPLSEKELRNLRAEAEKSRKHLIPIISQV